MTECVLHTTPCKDITTTASARIALYLAEKLNCPLYAQPPFVYKIPDRVFVVNSMGAFATSEHRIFMANAAMNAEQIIYVQNDFTIKPISQIQKVLRTRGWSHDFPFETGPILWTTVSKYLTKPQDSYVNWNQLTFKPATYEGPRVPGVVYWGSYRQGRVDSFKRYLDNPPYPVHLLVHPKVFSKFNGMGATQGKPWTNIEVLAAYDATIYLEDNQQHQEFHSLANRFYEALSAGVAIFIDLKALATFYDAGLWVSPYWVVENAAHVAEKLPQARMIAEAQRQIWAENLGPSLDSQVEEAYRRL